MGYYRAGLDQQQKILIAVGISFSVVIVAIFYLCWSGSDRCKTLTFGLAGDDEDTNDEDTCDEGEVKVGSECKTLGTECSRGNNFKAKYTADGCVETADCITGYIKVGSECKELGTECFTDSNFKGEYIADGCVKKLPPECVAGYVEVGSECKEIGTECDKGNNFEAEYTKDGCDEKIPLACHTGYVKVPIGYTGVFSLPFECRLEDCANENDPCSMFTADCSNPCAGAPSSMICSTEGTCVEFLE